jgi:hypothetical protein
VSPRWVEDHPEVLAGEARIAWADDEHPELHRYLREGAVSLPTRRLRPGRRRIPGRLVAWAELESWVLASRPGRFRRRVWWLTGHDPYPDGGHPAEAVDPCSIRPGHESRPARSA